MTTNTIRVDLSQLPLSSTSLNQGQPIATIELKDGKPFKVEGGRLLEPGEIATIQNHIMRMKGSFDSLRERVEKAADRGPVA